MKKFLAGCVLGVWLSVTTAAQSVSQMADSLERAMQRVQPIQFDSLFSAMLPQWAEKMDSASHSVFVQQLVKRSTAAASPMQQAAAWYAAAWYGRHLTSNYAQALYGYNRAFEKAEQAQNRVLMANAMLRSMETFIELGSFEEALQYLFKAEAVFQKYNYEGFRSVTGSLFGIGQFFHRAGNYTLSVQYFEKALVFNDLHDDDYGVMHAYNTLGLSYLRLKQYQKAVEVFQISNQMAREMGDVGWEALTHGNIGMVYYEQKAYAQAEEHLLYDIATSERVEGWASACNAAILLAEMYLEMKRPLQAAVYMRQARDFEQKAPALYLKQYLATLDVDYWVMLKNYERAYAAKLQLDSINLELDSKNEQQLRMQAEKRHAYEMQKKDLTQALELEQWQSEGAQWQRVVWVLLGLLLLLTAAAVVLIRREKRAHLLLLADLQHFQRNKQLQHFRSQLHHFAKIQALSSQNLPAPEGWRDQLREFVELQHPQFFSRMKSSFPSLTEADVEAMALIKLKFSLDEVEVLLQLESLDWLERMGKKLGGIPPERVITDIEKLG
jgi:tetratricopeptide (TPR) repeat protein